MSSSQIPISGKPITIESKTTESRQAFLKHQYQLRQLHHQSYTNKALRKKGVVKTYVRMRWLVHEVM